MDKLNELVDDIDIGERLSELCERSPVEFSGFNDLMHNPAKEDLYSIKVCREALVEIGVCDYGELPTGAFGPAVWHGVLRWLYKFRVIKFNN